MNSNEPFNPEEHKHELESVRRVVTQFVELRKWLLNTCLASLAFAITVFIQIRLNRELPNSGLGEFAIGSLIAASAMALFVRARQEAYSFVTDARGFMRLLPAIRGLLRSSAEILEQEKETLCAYLDRAIERSKTIEASRDDSSPYTEARLIAVAGFLLSVGLISLCAYVWLYLFAV